MITTQSMQQLSGHPIPPGLCQLGWQSDSDKQGKLEQNIVCHVLQGFVFQDITLEHIEGKSNNSGVCYSDQLPIFTREDFN